MYIGYVFNMHGHIIYSTRLDKMDPDEAFFRHTHNIITKDGNTKLNGSVFICGVAWYIPRHRSRASTARC